MRNIRMSFGWLLLIAVSLYAGASEQRVGGPTIVGGAYGGHGPNGAQGAAYTFAP